MHIAAMESVSLCTRRKSSRLFWNCNRRFALSRPRLGALPERWRQIEALAFALHEHGTRDGEAMKIDSRPFRRCWLLSVVKCRVDRASCLQQGVRLKSYRLPDYCSYTLHH